MFTVCFIVSSSFCLHKTYRCIHIEICTTNLRPFLQTLLIMEVIVHLIVVIVIFVYPNNNVQKNDIKTESVNNYASMADTEVLIETIVWTVYSHLPNKREVTLTDFEKFHPHKKNPPSMFIDFLDVFHPPLFVY